MIKWIILGTAFLIAGCAAFFSVTGIGQLFVGAPISAIAMASALELGKLVTVSFVYRYWNHVSRALRQYFVLASLILMIITSIGVYGYLTSAYAAASSGVRVAEQQVSVLTTQQQSITASIDRLTAQLTQSSDLLTKQEQRLDALVGRTGFAAQQRAVQQQNQRITQIQSELTGLTTTRDSLEQVKASTTAAITTTSKIGTFYYVASMLGVELDVVVRWFVLAIVFVFDPLSISLIIAYNIVRDVENRAKLSILQVSDSTEKPVHAQSAGFGDDVLPMDNVVGGHDMGGVDHRGVVIDPVSVSEDHPMVESDSSEDGLTDEERIQRRRLGITLT